MDRGRNFVGRRLFFRKNSKNDANRVRLADAGISLANSVVKRKIAGYLRF